MSNESYKQALYAVKRNFLIIGLTGYTGAGCSTSRMLLEDNKKFHMPDYGAVYKNPNDNKSKREKRIYDKLKRVWESNEWKWSKFVSIEFSNVIACFIVYSVLFESFKCKLSKLIKERYSDVADSLNKLKYLHESYDKNKGLINGLYDAYIVVSDRFTKILNDSGIDKYKKREMMQNFGDDIRRFGTVNCKGKKPIPDCLYTLPEAVRRLIKSYGMPIGYNVTPKHFVIDGFRNPFEVEYFRRRYSEFYLVAISRDEEERKKYLDIGNDNFEIFNRREQCRHINEKSKANIAQWISTQNIEECIQRADIFVENKKDSSKTYSGLKFSLIKLISLTKFPGCIPPSRDERSMQVAMTARQMSGCISRQVGACVVSKDGFIVGVGWNDPPSGQTPCSLRTGKELVDGSDEDVFSEYERSSIFIEQIQKNCYYDAPFCFKNEYVKIKKQDKFNEFTRALHAEENAFYQATGSCGVELPESTLYTTDRTCTLCAKKAYQLGVERIVYVNEYSDDAIVQTIKSGTRKILIQRFQGVTGSAYFRLFASLIPEKDIIHLY